jgi:hypothetical protein
MKLNKSAHRTIQIILDLYLMLPSGVLTFMWFFGYSQPTVYFALLTLLVFVYGTKSLLYDLMLGV